MVRQVGLKEMPRGHSQVATNHGKDVILHSLSCGGSVGFILPSAILK